MPCGTTGVVHDACRQDDELGSRGDWAHQRYPLDEVRLKAKIAGWAVDLYQTVMV
jgi:hypothetical protein